MGPVVLVVVDVVLEGFAALLFRRPGLDVGPFLEQGAVEALDLAVGLGPARRVCLGLTPNRAQARAHSPDL